MNPILELHTSATGGPAPGLTFETFFVGEPNREACLAAKSAAGSSTLLILCGDTGTGKTHLLNAIHAELLANNPAAVIKQLNSDDFISYLIQSIRAETTEQFRSDCQTADAFLLDDVQFLAGKERTQEELFLILEARCQSNRLTVITLDCTAEETIRSSFFKRFPDAVSATITEPDHEIRAAIVRAKAEDLGLRLSEEEMDLIAQQISGSLRNIHGVLNRINMYRSFPDAFPDAPTVEEIVCSINN